MASLRDVIGISRRPGTDCMAGVLRARPELAGRGVPPDLDDTLYPEDRARLAEIQAADPRAIVVNGYYSGYLSRK